MCSPLQLTTVNRSYKEVHKQDLLARFGNLCADLPIRTVKGWLSSAACRPLFSRTCTQIMRLLQVVTYVAVATAAPVYKALKGLEPGHGHASLMDLMQKPDCASASPTPPPRAMTSRSTPPRVAAPSRARPISRSTPPSTSAPRTSSDRP